MGTSGNGQRLARTAKLRLHQHDDDGPAWSVSWHWLGYDAADGSVIDQSGGSYTGDADEVGHKLTVLIDELGRHMHRGVDPFPPLRSINVFTPDRLAAADALADADQRADEMRQLEAQAKEAARYAKEHGTWS